MRSARAGRARRRWVRASGLVLLAACGSSPAPDGPTGAPPLRVVSLVPAASAMVAELGLASTVVGRTEEDRTPAVQAAPSVGHVLTPDLESVVGLRPDVLLAWGGADLAGLRAAVAPLGTRVLALDLRRLADVAAAWRDVARAVGRAPAGRDRAAALDAELDRLRALRSEGARPRVLWVVGDRPLVAVGSGTFLDDVLAVAGADNVVGDAPTAWPRPAFETLAARNPDLVLWGAPSAPPAPSDHPWSTVPAVRDGRVIRLDPDRFHEPGPDLAAVALVLSRLIHAGAAPAPSSGTP